MSHHRTIPACRILQLAACLALAATGVRAAQVTIPVPPLSANFGTTVVVLANGDIAVAEPGFDDVGPVIDVGAVHVFRPDGSLVGTMTGRSEGDRIGSRGLTPLGPDSVIVASPEWDAPGATDAGAVTVISATRGIPAVVTAQNSLVGSTAGDRVGERIDYVNDRFWIARSLTWDHGAAADAGAVSVGSVDSPLVGPVSALNSLVGARTGDQVGSYGVFVGPDVPVGQMPRLMVCSPNVGLGTQARVGAATVIDSPAAARGVVSTQNSLMGSNTDDAVCSGDSALLPNGAVLVGSPGWRHAGQASAGALTYIAPGRPATGSVGPDNSLVGSHADDQVGRTVIPVGDGNYVVSSPFWDDGALANVGAVTFGTQAQGVTGTISASNSLLGRSAQDLIASDGIRVLTNGNYVVRSPLWDRGGLADVGAVTFGSGAVGVRGRVTEANSTFGRSAGDQVGNNVRSLDSGNYIIGAPQWDDAGMADVGAVVVGSGTTGRVGEINAANSLHGSHAGDLIGNVLIVVGGGAVVCAAFWDHGNVVDAGSATFVGDAGLVGVPGPGLSLHGTTAGDNVCFGGATVLRNGDYVVRSPRWQRSGFGDVGATTFGRAGIGVSGAVAPTNSLVGGVAGDHATMGIASFSDGSYALALPAWDAPAAVNAGAVVFVPAGLGVTGFVNEAVALVGSSAEDSIGSDGLAELSGGRYAVRSPLFDRPGATNAGAVSIGRVDAPLSGPVTAQNSVLGAAAQDRVGRGTVDDYGADGLVVYSSEYRSGGVRVGAVTLVTADGSGLGPVLEPQSVVGRATGNAAQPLRYIFDPTRIQLVVGEPGAPPVGRVVLLRPGRATTARLQASANPAPVGGAVTYTVTVSTAQAPAPLGGRATLRAAGGASCTDDTPIQVAPNEVVFQCALAFPRAGSFEVVAEYTGSAAFDYARATPLQQQVGAPGSLFVDGFEP